MSTPAPEDRKDTMVESAAGQPETAAAVKRGPSIATREKRQGVINPSGETPYLVVEDLSVKFPTADGVVSAVNGLSYAVPLGRTLAIVGVRQVGVQYGRDGPARPQADPDHRFDPDRW